MALESRNIFVDTESYKNLGLNFNHPALKSFLELCRKRKLFHLTTSIVEREVKSKIHASIQEALDSLRAFRRKARLLENIGDGEIDSLFAELNPEEIHRKAIAVFDDYLKVSEARILSADKVNVENILGLYFNHEPPFGEGKKKNEFPDAITLHCLVQEMGNDSIYIVSGDSDLEEFCKNNKSLIYIDSLNKLLDIFNEHESAITKLIKEHVTEEDSAIKDRILHEINSAWAYNESSWEDSEVDEFSAVWVGEYEPEVVHIDEESALITFDVDVELTYTVTGPDFSGGIYDKEEGKMYTFGTTTLNGMCLKTFTVELSYSFKIEEDKLADTAMTELNVFGLYDGIAFHMEENEVDW